ncbi:ThuA domain-containing protein [Hyunsoonleella flava]|uniref:ThuA domain-containing protein n=1 Tax=Hyunsoonleella flava TaxID=2527939 RepID=A0A4Q9FC47_9FLAO|nr:ThuA domain-containing protein [Hyunsoonleella flava]TBN02938.1 ThuA domain-containing protein [Hyunsoonleella flava]
MRILIIILLVIGFNSPGFGQNVLVFTKTGHYRHTCLPEAIKGFVEMAEENNWKCTFTEDATFFTKGILNKFDVVVFLLTNKDILTETQQMSFKGYIKSGGGFVGVHSATVTELKWPWFGDLIGARFIGHSGVQKGKIIIEDNTHPATEHLDIESIDWEDEWYSLNKSPRENVNVLISLDENSITMKNFNGKDMSMGDHPIAWYHVFDGGRIFQTQLGHRPELYQNPIFRKHIIGAIHWASKKVKQ